LVWNPIVTLLTNIFLTLITPFDIIGSTLMTILGSDDDHNFYDLAICWAGLMYFPIHAVVDPLWELLASVTRLMGAFGGGLPAACNWLEDCFTDHVAQTGTGNGSRTTEPTQATYFGQLYSDFPVRPV
jgi:hypothetical protein